jgi:hypothetical protein
MSKAVQRARDAATERAKAEEAARPRQIITPQIKSDVAFQKKLADFCRGDASHDLGDTIKFTDKVLPVFNEALPNESLLALSEPEILHSVILGLTGANRTQKIDSLNSKLAEVPNVTITSEQAPSVIDIGYVNNGQNVNLFKYNVVRFNIPSSTNNVTANGPSCNTDFGETFVKNTKLGTKEAAFIVDFSQHHFMEKLVQGKKYANFTIHYLMTPEVVNDPAGKPNVDNKTIFSTNTGVNLYSYVQRNIEPVCYTPFTQVEANPLNNFFSKYDFVLSPIKQIFTKNSASQLVSTLDIKYIPPSSKPYTATIEDSKKQNSITSVLGYIKKIINGLNTGSRPEEKFNFNVKCQQKRGGDWFQVLCCLDARNRTYTRILPNDTTRSEWTIPDDCPVYFVSHDQIAVAYALLNGVNVIYLDYYGRIFVFTNSADSSLAGTRKPIDEILFEGIKSRYVVNTTGEKFGFNELITYANNYTKYRNEIIREEIETYNTVLNTSRQTIQDPGLENRKNSEYMPIVTQVLKNIFTAAVRLMFVKINLIDISQQIIFVNNNKGLFSNNYQKYDDNLISRVSDNINLIRGIIDKYGKIALEDTNYKTNIINWITNNIRNLDVYRAANNLTLENCGLDNKVNRIITFTRGQDTRFNDKYIFLPFIQTLSSNNDYSPPTNELNALIELLNSVVKPSLDTFIEKLSQPTSTLKNIITAIRTTRSGRDPNHTFYNCTINLIYEANILLKIEKDATNFLKEDDVPVLDSTDNIIMSEDDIEINEFKKGKMSNYSESEDTISRQQGGWTFAQLPEPGSRKVDLKSVVCDVSIRQMTWPLLTNIFVTNKTSYTAEKMVKAYKKYLPDGRIPTTYEWLFTTNNGSENYDFTNDPIITEINNEITMFQRLRDAMTVDRLGEAGVVVASGFLGRIPLAVTVVSVALYETYKAVKRGGADDDMSVTIPETPTDELLKDFTICYHPLMPIYMLLSPFFYTLGPKFESYPFFYTYFTYVNVLEKMVDVLDKNYLNDPTNNNNILAAYFIGRSLGTFLFTSNTCLLQNDKILEMIGMSQDGYYDFSLKNDSFASLISGSIHLTPEEEVLGFVFLRSELFKNFINVEVNIKQILEEGTPVEGLPSYMDLKDRIYNLIHRIVVKVNVDRGTPLAADIDDAIAAGIQIPDDAIVEDIQTPDAIVEDIQTPDNAVVEDIQTPDDANKQKMINFRFKRPGNRLPLTTIPTRVRGGKMTKNRCKKRVSTRKNKKTKLIKSSKKTRKHKRSHKRSRKNLN